jgi:truncated hemoglobin YjbI
MKLFRSKAASVHGAFAQSITPREPTPLEQLGGPDVIARVVNHFYPLVLQDPYLFGYFAHIDMEHLRDKLTRTLVELLGGDKTYRWDLVTAHQGRGITNAAYSKVAGYLYETLLDFNVPPALIKVIMAKVIDVADMIIERPSVTT